MCPVQSVTYLSGRSIPPTCGASGGFGDRPVSLPVSFRPRHSGMTKDIISVGAPNIPVVWQMAFEH